MIYSIIYDAVRKKTRSPHHNALIANVEMAASMGIILKECGKSIDLTDVKEPIDIRNKFDAAMKEVSVDTLSEENKKLMNFIDKYKVKEMVNEKLYNLVDLVNMKKEDEGGEE